MGRRKENSARLVATRRGFSVSLSRNPVPEFHTSFDILRFYVSQASLDELPFDRGLRRAAGLNDCLGLQDPVMHGLAIALLDPVEQANERSALFIDHIALAFHAQLTSTETQRCAPIPSPAVYRLGSCAALSIS